MEMVMGVVADATTIAWGDDCPWIARAAAPFRSCLVHLEPRFCGNYQEAEPRVASGSW